MLKGLMGALFPKGGEKFMDDKGAFRGGDEGRVLGRVKDALGIASRDESGNKETMENTQLVKQQQMDMNELMSHAREFAKNLDPSSADDILSIQGMLNQLGITDSEGGKLEEDSMLGNKTLSAIRKLQGAQAAMPAGNDIASNVAKLFGTAGAFEEDRDKSQTSGAYTGIGNAMGTGDLGSTILGRKGLFKNNPYWPFEDSEDTVSAKMSGAKDSTYR